MSYICRQCVRINFRHIQYVCNFFIDYIFINTAPATDKCCFVRICYAADFDCVFYRVCFYIFCSTIGWHRLEFWEIATAYNISPTAQWVMWQVIKSCCPKNTRMVHSCFFEKIKIFIRMQLYQIGIRSLVATKTFVGNILNKLYQIGITGQWVTKNKRKDPASPECRCELGLSS